MKNFNYISRDYVNPIDLNVLGKTYNTLEQGHHDAIKAASDLEVTMGNLPLNEAEAPYRQQKIAEIKQLVTDNSNYGNAYSALDNIIAEAGKLAADEGMIGRLQAQKDYTAYIDNLDKRNDLPQDYKDYYKEKNQYHYADKIDEKTGKVIGGTKWTPTATATQVVPLNELINQGLKWAAKQSGGGEQTRWIDSSGAITNDPSKAFDGQVYNSTSNQWESLSKDKIRQGIEASIATTPGAKESLNQDYTIAKWKHDKQVAANNGKPFESDVTDKNGIFLNETQYLRKRIDPAIQANAYYNSINKTTYGQGLVTYKAAQAAAAKASATQTNNMNQAMISGRDTPVEVAVDAASTFTAGKSVASNQLKGLYKQITGSDLFIPTNERINNINQLLDKHNISTEGRQQIRSLVKAYNENYDNLKTYTDRMSPEDKAEFDFVSRLKSGGELKSSANGGSKSDDIIIQQINNMYGPNGDKIQVSMKDDAMKEEFKNLISGGQYNGFKNLGIDIHDKTVIIPKSAMNSIPLIFNALEKARASAENIRKTKDSFLDKFTKPQTGYRLDALDQSGNVIKPADYNEKYNKFAISFMNINNTYNKADDINKKILNKYKLSTENIQLSSLNLDGKSFTEAGLLNRYQKGMIDEKQYNLEKKYYDDSFDKILSNTDFSQMDMYKLGEKDNVKKRVVDGAERFNYGADILKAVKDKRITVSPSIVPGINDPVSGAPIAGYNITILPEKKDGKQTDAPPTKFYIPGLVNETASKQLMQDPTVQAFNTIAITGGTRSTKSLTDNNTNPKLGNISVTGLGNNNFVINFNGIQKVANQTEAVKLTTALNNYNAVKDKYMSDSHGQQSITLSPQMKSTIANSAIEIGALTGVKPEAILERLIDDINK